MYLVDSDELGLNSILLLDRLVYQIGIDLRKACGNGGLEVSKVDK